MEKEKIIEKLKLRDYNKELEEMLASKPFSKDAKNLLSSMLYKIENSYEDYKKIKVEVPAKKELLEELLEIIAVDCDEIEIVKPEENLIPEGKKSIAIKKKQKIVTYQNELALIQAIYDLHNKNNECNDEELSKRAFSQVLQEGEKNSRSEIIRDFDGWSWNVMIGEIGNYISNIIYQNFVYLVGFKEFNENIKLEEFEKLLKEKYNQELADKIINTAMQLAIIEYIKEKPEENEKLEKLEKQLNKQLSLMEEKNIYVEKITNQKKTYIKEIEQIDKYANDDLKLKREYIKQNEKLPQEQRVFSLSDFSEKIEDRRNFLQIEVRKLTEKLKPQNYVKEKNEIEKEINFIKEIKIDNEKEVIKKFIELCLKAINMQSDKITVKKEVANKIAILRYLKQINIEAEKTVGDLCKKEFEKTEKKLITIGCNLKALNILSQDVAENYRIYKNIFNTKIIDLESAYIEISKDNMVQIYDENSLEKEEKIEEIKELFVKRDKKIKIFI